MTRVPVQVSPSSRETTYPQSTGRPRDPALETRVLAAATQIYAQQGWPGFTFERVALAARTGKGALYRRWANPAALLAAMLESRWAAIGEIDEGSLAADLRMAAGLLMNQMADNNAAIAIRIQVDSRTHKEVRTVVAPFRQRAFGHVRALMARAAARGELASDADARLVTDVLVGTLTNHVLATPEHLMPAMRQRAGAFIDALVAMVLAGLREERNHG